MRKLINSKGYKKVFGTSLIVMALMAVMAVAAFAEGTTVAVDDVTSITTGITSIFQSVASNFSFTNLVAFIGIAIGSASVIALGWFGLRKVISMIQTALKKGRVKV